MITSFIVGLLLGLTLGWLRLRVVAKELVAATKQRETLTEALKRSAELFKQVATTMEHQHTVNQLTQELSAFDSSSIN